MSFAFAHVIDEVPWIPAHLIGRRIDKDVRIFHDNAGSDFIGRWLGFAPDSAGRRSPKKFPSKNIVWTDIRQKIGKAVVERRPMLVSN